MEDQCDSDSDAGKASQAEKGPPKKKTDVTPRYGIVGLPLWILSGRKKGLVL